MDQDFSPMNLKYFSLLENSVSNPGKCVEAMH